MLTKHTQPNIIVASHRRSGTHLTIDSIINNFKLYQNNPEIESVNLNLLSKQNPHKTNIKELLNNTKGLSTIFKTHSTGDFNLFFDLPADEKSQFNQLINNSKIIYVYRDGRDVLTSQYYYHQKISPDIENISVSDYIRMINDFDTFCYDQNFNRVEFWSFHINSWLKRKNILFISFEDWQNDYKETLQKISKFINIPINEKIIDTRRKPENKLDKLLNKFRRHRLLKKIFGMKLSTVLFRKGTSGDWNNHFNKNDLTFFNNYANDTMKRLKYYK